MKTKSDVDQAVRLYQQIADLDDCIASLARGVDIQMIVWPTTPDGSQWEKSIEARVRTTSPYFAALLESLRCHMLHDRHGLTTELIGLGLGLEPPPSPEQAEGPTLLEARAAEFNRVRGLQVHEPQDRRRTAAPPINMFG